MKFSNSRLTFCVELAMKENDLRKRRVKLLQLLDIMDAKPSKSQAFREDRAQLVRLLNQTNEFLDSREAL